VLQGLRVDDKSAAFEPYVMGALELIRQVAEGIANGTTNDEVLRGTPTHRAQHLLLSTRPSTHLHA
jgi:hypothetical protein